MVPALAALAIGPGLLLVHLVWSRDRWREPIGNLLVYVALGAVCLFPAAFVESALREPVLSGIVEDVEALNTAVCAFPAVALVEETANFGASRSGSCACGACGSCAASSTCRRPLACCRSSWPSA